jgi:cell division septal protein FtsQ
MNRRRIGKVERKARSAGQVRRGFVAFARVSAAGGIASAVLVGVFFGWTSLRTGGQFTVKNVVFSGNQRASSADLLAMAGPLRGANIFVVDLSAAGRAMEQHPWVEHARVARDLPDTLRVAIEERVAVALVSASGLYAVDAGGQLFKAVVADDHLDLPLISGFSREMLTRPDGTANASLLAALRVVKLYGAHTMSLRAPLSELRLVDEAGEHGFVAYCGDAAVEVRLGVLRGDFENEMSAVLGRFERVWNDLEHRGVRARSIDLGNRQRPDWVPARLETPATVALGSVHSSK